MSRRCLLSLAALALAAWVGSGRSLHPYFAATGVLTARELSAVRVGAEPVTFFLPDESTRVRILVNLELAQDVPLQDFRLVVQTPGGGEERFPLRARGRSGAGATTGFILGEALVPAATREVFLGLPLGGGRLALRLEPPELRGAVRVLVERPRPALARQVLEGRLNEARRERLAAHLGSLPWDALSDEQRRQLLDTRWSRLAPEGEVPRRRLFLNAVEKGLAQPQVPTGVTVHPGHPLAWTIAGPGLLELHALDAAVELDVRLTTVAGPGAGRSVHLAAGQAETLAVGVGLSSLRVASASDARLNVVASGLHSTAGEPLEGELAPSESKARFVEVGTGEVEWEVDGVEPLQLEARLPCATGEPSVVLTLVALDAAGHQVGTRQWPVLAPPGPALVASEALLVLSELRRTVLHLPASTRRLRVTAESRAFVGLLSALREPGEALPAGHGPMQLRALVPPRWWRLAPAGELELLRAGRLSLVHSPLMLEPTPSRPRPAQLTSLQPLGDPPRWRVLQGAESASPHATRWWSLGTAPVKLALASPSTLRLAYLSEPAPGSIALGLDGVEQRAPALAARGEVPLGPLSAGAHTLRVDIPPGTRVWVNQAAAGRPLFREFQLAGLEVDAPLRYRVVTPGHGSTRVALAVTGDQPAPGAQLEVEIDDGHPFSASAMTLSRERTFPRRSHPLQFAPLDGVFLTRSGPLMLAARPVFVHLADDLTAGPHLLTVRLRGTSHRLYVRGFSWNEP